MTKFCEALWIGPFNVSIYNVKTGSVQKPEFNSTNIILVRSVINKHRQYRLSLWNMWKEIILTHFVQPDDIIISEEIADDVVYRMIM